MIRLRVLVLHLGSGAAAMLALCLGAGQIRAQAAPYAGKQIRMVVGSGPGGGLDVYARVLAAHMADHVPGRPSIVVENMPGAIGLAAMNWLSHSAPRDGTAIVASSNVALVAPLFGNRAARFDPRQLVAVGSIGKQHSICATWRTSPIKTIEQAERRQVVVAADAASSRSATIPEMLNAMLGTKFKVVTGYATTDIGMALERGEAEGVCGLSWSTLKAAHPEWVRDHLLNVLAQTGDQPQADLPDVPVLIRLVSNPDDTKILRLLGFPDELGRPYLMAPDAPQNMVETIRRAFDETMKDPAFLADARRSMLDVDPISGEDMARILDEAYATPASLIAKAAPFSGAPGR